MHRDSKTALVIVGILLAVTVGAWWILLDREQRDVVTVAFLDVGQGDAIFIETPTGIQVLVDGGSGREVLRELGRVMPFYDRSIDMVVATHLDADHIGGLVDVLQRFSVAQFLRPGVQHDTSVTEALTRTIVAHEIPQTLARRGDVFDLGDGLQFTVLFPDRDVAHVESNTGSIVAQLAYGKHTFLLTGDSPTAVEEYLVSLDGGALKSDVLKVGHHGSDTSSSRVFVGFVDPQYAIVSRGCDNRHGHPHHEVLDTLNQFEVEVFDTCEDGTVIFETDGSILRFVSR